MIRWSSLHVQLTSVVRHGAATIRLHFGVEAMLETRARSTSSRPYFDTSCCEFGEATMRRQRTMLMPFDSYRSQMDASSAYMMFCMSVVHRRPQPRCCGLGLGFRAWRLHHVLRWDRHGRALCVGCGLTTVAAAALECRPCEPVGILPRVCGRPFARGFLEPLSLPPRLGCAPACAIAVRHDLELHAGSYGEQAFVWGLPCGSSFRRSIERFVPLLGGLVRASGRTRAQDFLGSVAPDSASHLTNIGQILPVWTTSRPIRPESLRFGPMLGQVLAELDRDRLNSAWDRRHYAQQRPRRCADFDHVWPDLGPLWAIRGGGTTITLERDLSNAVSCFGHWRCFGLQGALTGSATYPKAKFDVVEARGVRRGPASGKVS